MADGGDPEMRTVHFHWRILRPFLPARRITALFYSGGYISEQWKVTLTPLNRTMEDWTFRFSLRRVVTWEPDSISAQNLRVNISMYLSEDNEDVIAVTQEAEDHHEFSDGNPFEFQASIRCSEDFFQLNVEVEMSLGGQHYEHEQGLFYRESDLRLLSTDLRRLFRSGLYSDMTLKPDDADSYHNVHSFIIQARSPEFLQVHKVNPEESNPTIETLISDDLLERIITYLYTGIFNTSERYRESIPVTMEIFQVIDLYKLHHLFQVYTTDDSKQLRITTNNVEEHRYEFQLHDPATGLPLPPRVRTWEIDRINDFQIEFFLHHRHPWFRYRMRFRNPEDELRHVRVNLELVKKKGGIRIIRNVHRRDYRVQSNQLEESGSCHFEGGQRELEDFVLGRSRTDSHGQTIGHFIHCIVYLSDGSSVTQVMCVNNITRKQRKQERREVLSAHMHVLMTDPLVTDLKISTVSESEGSSGATSHSFQKAVFETRVPGWRGALVTTQEEDHLECSCLNPSAFLRLQQYIYTGKIRPIPSRFLDEIDDFVERTGFETFGRICRESNEDYNSDAD